MIPFNIIDWRRSVVSLAIEIAHLKHKRNQMTTAAQARGEYFFADSGVPVPRPCTALAWASLCAFGPASGKWNVESSSLVPFSLTEGRFVLPFLPKVLLNEEASHSLARQSKIHVKDYFGRIRWGNVFIADCASGEILEQLPHASRNVKEFILLKHNEIIPDWIGQIPIPPLYASEHEGWQFGQMQNIPQLAMNVRESMVQLAQHGIMETQITHSLCPKIRRLMIRFLDIEAAKAWARAYADSVSICLDPETARQDRILLSEQIVEQRNHEEKGHKKGHIDFYAINEGKSLTEQFAKQFLGE